MVEKGKRLLELSKPFSDKLIKQKPNSSKASYVPHSIVAERLLQVVGNYDMKIVEVIRGDIPEKKGQHKSYPAQAGVVVGAIIELGCHVDNDYVVIQEVGSCENPQLKGNDGDRLKDAVSDAFKRCAMRLGLGLHLWSRESYFLHKVLLRDSESDAKAAEGGEVGSDLPPAADGVGEEPEREPDEDAEDEGEAPQKISDIQTRLNEEEFSVLLDHLDNAGIPEEQHQKFMKTVAEVDWNGEVLPEISHDQAAVIAHQADRYKEQHLDDSGRYAPEPEKPIYSDPPAKGRSTTDPPVKEKRNAPAEDELLNTKGQSAMHMQLSNYGFRKEEHYALVSDWLGREITSFAEVRTDEQAKVYAAARQNKK